MKDQATRPLKLRLATRGSALAIAQSTLVAERIRRLGHSVDLVTITTPGDVTSAPLTAIGGMGVFVEVVRHAVLAGECDFAVHSFKDLPVATPPGLVLAAVPARENAADALCSRDGLRLDQLPVGAKIGTGSPRRAALLRAQRPDIQVVPIRGNVETRLRRTTTDVDAIVLAVAGLRRLGRVDAISEEFDPELFLPAPGQGALAVECRDDASPELLQALATLDDRQARITAITERAVLAGLEAGCAAPVGAYASVDTHTDTVSVIAGVFSENGHRRLVHKDSTTASLTEAERLGRLVAQHLLDSGAAAITTLAASRTHPLQGRSVLVPTRAPEGLSDALTAAGAEVVHADLTRTVPLPREPWVQALSERWDWVVVTSASTVGLLTSPHDRIAWPSSTKVAAVGPATAAALEQLGITPQLVANPGGGASLAALFDDGPGRVLFPGALTRSTEPARSLTAKGWTVREVPLYRTVADGLPPAVRARWSTLDAFVVTAGSVARAAIDDGGLPGPGVIAIGESAAQASTDAGLRVIGVASSPDTPGVMSAAVNALR